MCDPETFFSFHKPYTWCFPIKYLNTQFLVSRKIEKLWPLLYYLSLFYLKIIEPFYLNLKPSFLLFCFVYGSKFLIQKILPKTFSLKLGYDHLGHNITKWFLKILCFKSKYLPNGLPYVTLKSCENFYL
jgi:hypothetical protein